jgi:hypothetical protein
MGIGQVFTLLKEKRQESIIRQSEGRLKREKTPEMLGFTCRDVIRLKDEEIQRTQKSQQS